MSFVVYIQSDSGREVRCPRCGMLGAGDRITISEDVPIEYLRMKCGYCGFELQLEHAEWDLHKAQ